MAHVLSEPKSMSPGWLANAVETTRPSCLRACVSPTRVPIPIPVSAASHEQCHCNDYARHTQAADSREDRQVPGLKGAHVGLPSSRCPRAPYGNRPPASALPCERRPHSDGWTSAPGLAEERPGAER